MKCERCGMATDNAKHVSACNRSPKPQDLISLMESGEHTPRSVASQYDIGLQFVRTRLRLGGASAADIKRYAANDENHERCLRCDLIIIHKVSIVHPTWSIKVQLNIDGYCPGCHEFVSTGHERILSDVDILTSVFSGLSVQ